MLSPTDFPNDIDALKAMLVAAEARDQRKQERIDRLELQCNWQRVWDGTSRWSRPG